MQLLGPAPRGKERPESLAERIYAQLKDDIFEFRLLPGDRFSESEIAVRMSASRTPVRLALYRLEREGYLEVYFRSGWQVRPFDFQHFEELYDVRVVLEMEAVKRLCEWPDTCWPEALQQLVQTWQVAPAARLQDGAEVSRLDERFHCQLLEAAGNREMARLHAEVSEKIRIIRRLDFTRQPRIELTYEEHARILEAILRRRCEQAQSLLKAHIEVSKAEVRKVTLHMLHNARQRALAGQG
ncbi:GntR family transcriptional regulator [Pseudomonas sp. DTU_2021_1001937_2_SI_NGA_ILE_001]|uniref:GntR family transcriptional regulator n=1 Tax=Pseudomonas sp. DTU_2021_1001937_2_SI_NGA_ILE_001 TaxID=3077589 RepID=UPI0025D1A65C|nr:GntR family transcriptional regulator [Pseudomonas sp. DTU_2021_1001937_2_SI_NGA_ILE_001]WNW13596.1 GntR family transcriptional regulator [Pseudomonas sp. DTU_2021_1001937_2_SI_NGA_ILE_001]